MYRTLREGVVILYNEPGPGAAESDRGVLDEVWSVRESLDRMGYPCRVAPVGELGEIGTVLGAGPEAVVFNLVEGFPGNPAAAVEVPPVCNAFGKAVTGGDGACLSLTLNKYRTKLLLRGAGIPVPDGYLWDGTEPVDIQKMPAGPIILKPVALDASEGIHAADCIFPDRTAAGVVTAVERMYRKHRQPVLVEQMVGTREFNISVLSWEGQPRVLPIAEIDFSAFEAGRPRIVDYAAKWRDDSFEYHHTPRRFPDDLPEGWADRLRSLALAAWRAVGCSGYARFDFRAETDGRFFLLEVNANPDISPDAGFAAALSQAGIPYDDFVEEMILEARHRNVHSGALSPDAVVRDGVVTHPGGKGSGPKIRTLRAEDREALIRIIWNMPLFRPDERVIAREVLDDSIQKVERSGYLSQVVEAGGEVLGWVCYGPTPCTIGTYDLYWIVVSQEKRGSGYGSLLMEAAEADIRRRNGRMIVLDTSGQEIYELTRRFYLKHGFQIVATLDDFYLPGDPKVVFRKDLC